MYQWLGTEEVEYILLLEERSVDGLQARLVGMGVDARLVAYLAQLIYRDRDDRESRRAAAAAALSAASSS